MRRIAIAILAIIALAVVFSGCEITKGKKSASFDQTGVSKKTASSTDSSAGGGIKKTESNSKEQYDWYRTIMQYLPGQYRDTNITNVYNYPQQPATIIYEGGKGTKEQNTNTFDSTWFKNALASAMASMDSLKSIVQTSEKNKQSETKGVGLVLVIIVAVAAVVLYALLTGYLKRFRIVKREV